MCDKKTCAFVVMGIGKKVCVDWRFKGKELIYSAESLKPSYCTNHKEAMHAKKERGTVSHFHRSLLKKPRGVRSISAF